MSVLGKGKAASAVVKGQPGYLKSIEMAAVAVVIAVWLATGPLSCNDGNGEPKFPAHGPGEFLYLDGARVLGYLAQFDGGTFTSKQLTSKSSDTVNSKLSVQNALELGENSSQEESVSKRITPTAAGNYIELLAKLEGLDDGLETIGLGRFEHQVSKLTEGQFVRFQTHGLRPPVYLNPYLAVRQRETLSTLFPMPVGDEAGRERVLLQRSRARRFRDQVGKDPRVVFALRPLNAKELKEGRAEVDEGPEVVAQASRGGGGTAKEKRKEEALRRREAKRKREEENHVQYLMPMDAELLTRERSLIKFGGGEFTVVGKLVRVFPEPGNPNEPPYVDSPTVETWQQPLAAAPLQLLCRTDHRCTTNLQKDDLTPAERRKVIENSRAWAIDALEEQTRIPKRGAVILPIAIYK